MAQLVVACGCLNGSIRAYVRTHVASSVASCYSRTRLLTVVCVKKKSVSWLGALTLCFSLLPCHPSDPNDSLRGFVAGSPSLRSTRFFFSFFKEAGRAGRPLRVYYGGL